MNIEITIANKKGRFNAKGIYDGRQVIVQKGGYINPSFSTCIKGGNLSKKYRSDSAFVSDSFEIREDCVFKSPSTAAQFVTGRSVDGYKIWKVSDGKTLEEYLKEKGLR